MLDEQAAELRKQAQAFQNEKQYFMEDVQRGRGLKPAVTEAALKRGVVAPRDARGAGRLDALAAEALGDLRHGRSTALRGKRDETRMP